MAVYLATSPKSNSTYMAIGKALAIVEKTGDLPVPLHLRNAPTSLMKEIGYSKDYKYAHDYENNFIPMQFMPDGLIGEKLYETGNNPKEKEILKHLSMMWKDYYSY